MAEKRSADQPASGETEVAKTSKNAMSELVDFTGNKAPAGIFKLNRTPYYTPKELKAPFKIDIIVKTDSMMTIAYERGYVEFNFDPNQQPISYWDSKTGDEGGIVDSTASSPINGRN